MSERDFKIIEALIAEHPSGKPFSGPEGAIIRIRQHFESLYADYDLYKTAYENLRERLDRKPAK